MVRIFTEHVMAGCGAQRDTADGWLTFIREAADRAEIDTPRRVAAFLANIGHESMSLTRLEENLYYTDPVRVARIFRSPFDLDNDRVVDPEEIEFAKGYTRNPVKLANRAYANRMGNGPESSGDGWKYRGKGLIQVTGKTNHLLCGIWLDLDLLTRPDLLLTPRYAALSAAWFWHNNHLNELADTGDLVRLTKRINGGLHGHDDRVAKFEKAMATFA